MNEIGVCSNSKFKILLLYKKVEDMTVVSKTHECFSFTNDPR